MKWTLALESTLSLGNVEVFKYEGERDNRLQNTLVFVTIGRGLYISV